MPTNPKSDKITHQNQLLPNEVHLTDTQKQSNALLTQPNPKDDAEVLNHQELSQLQCPPTNCKSEPRSNEKYKCTDSKQCMDNYLRCPYSCYVHKVCRKPFKTDNLLKPGSAIIRTVQQERIETSENLTYDNDCPSKGSCKPVHAWEDTKHLRCYGNDNCQDGYLCCPNCL